MKRTVYTTLLFTALLTTGSAVPAHAQFWKKIFKKEQPTKRKPAPKKPVAPEKPLAKPAKKREVDYPATTKKDRYRVDVLIPLYLSEMVKDGKPVYKGKMPEKAVSGVEFYHGVKLAADTLNKLGYNIDVHIHDITDANSTPEKLLAQKVFEQTDLIIGATQSQQIPVIADAAKKNTVNFISALSPADGGVENNAYFTLLQPSLQTHCEWIVKNLKNKHHKNEPLLLYRPSGIDENPYKYINAANNELKKLNCTNFPTAQQLKPYFDSTKTNTIIVSILDNGYSERILQLLYTSFPGYRFEVYGMPSWKSMPTLKKPEAYPNVAVFITSPFYYDSSLPLSQTLANSYKSIGGTTQLSEMVYRGYETMFWYASMLKKYGTIFNENMDDNKTAPFTKFEIKRQWDSDNNLYYNENMHIYLYRYQSSSYTVVQ
jgi:ABC-type branched-subunit amino acid transport system substrate-binding protein